MFSKETKKQKIDDLVNKLTVSLEADDIDFGDDSFLDEETNPETEIPEENADTVPEETGNDNPVEVEATVDQEKEVDPLEEKDLTGEDTTITEEMDEKPEALAVQTIGSEPKPLIFLGGTCSGSNWRDPFMEKLTDAPFNPYIKDVEWTTQAAQNEVAMRNAAAKIVFGITPKQKGPLTIFELGISIISSPDRTVVMILEEDEGDTWAEATKKAIDVIRASCEAQKVPVFDNPDQCIAFLNGEGDSFNEDINTVDDTSTDTTFEKTGTETETEETLPVEETETSQTDEVDALAEDETPDELDTEETVPETEPEPEVTDEETLEDDDSAAPDDL